MRSSFLGLEVSKRSIQLAQKALDVTGGNLANVNTEGYTRQRVDVGSLAINQYSYWQSSESRLTLVGQGARAFGVDQIRDPYIDRRYRESTCYVAEYSTSQSIMEEVETVLDDIASEGLTKQLDVFADAMSQYAQQPDSEELASIVRNQAYNITSLLRSYHTDLENLKESNLETLNTTIENTNNIIRDIVDYNKRIVREYTVMASGKLAAGQSVTGSYGPNELLDARNLLVDELSYLGNIVIHDNADGSIRVEMNGVEIINGDKYETLYMRGSTKVANADQYSSELLRNYAAYDAAVLRWTSGDEATFKSGEIKSYLDALNGNGVYKTGYQNDSYGIPYYESVIDAFANDFANLMNYLNGGVDENGTVIDADRLMFCTKEYNEGKSFYEDKLMTADNIRIANCWMDDATMIGEVQQEDGTWKLTQDGNHVNEMLVQYGKKSISFGGKGDYEGTVYDYLLFINNRIGQQIDFDIAQYESSYITTSALLDSREAVAGVNKDEEGINMLEYKNWYNASSRMMTTLDDCLDRLINNTGRAGL
ncbi:MAG: flagellar hook-associated protein FlgK [Bacteroides sp.]|nr:flagellar hook-associated protein FlgK [Eubacterium sp.]MCM1418539.1 flagellar hook-associated protein FlgK [Roseburia sp.]MCM1462579.1 flagellar hook-associated protein FlgK [Bacteroides sp.]